ncbi:MAG: hypothetical protein ABEK03_10145, partial [Candidatus Bipolaricaulia bacterium]
MLNRHKALSAALTLVFALTLTIPAYGQVEMTDDGFQAKAVEPGEGIPMDTTTDPAALGSGITVMRFDIKDIDPQADDPSDVTITELQVDNLGTANQKDIVEVMCLDGAGNAIAPLGTPSSHSNPNITFQAFCDTDSYVIPDGQKQTFEIAVRTAGTNTLQDDDQNNSLRLRVTAKYEEKVGSPPRNSTFTAEVTDSKPETIYNGGLNDVSEETYGTSSLMPGNQGVVSRFTVCDKDSNEHNLVMDELLIKQGDDGTALFSDFASLKLYRVENSGRTQVGSVTPNVSANRGGAGDSLPIPTNVYLQDDHCTTFEIEAHVSPFAYKGKVIQFEYQISTEEPVSWPIAQSVDPQLVTSQPTAIGKGVLQIADAVLLPERSNGDRTTVGVPLKVKGFPLPGFGGLQVGSNTLSYDPSVVRVKDVVGVDLDNDDTNDYVVDVVEKDNRRGEVRFTVRLNQATDEALDKHMSGADVPLEELPQQDGPVAFIRVEGVGKPGDSTRMNLTFEEVKTADNQAITDDVGTDSGVMEIVPPGDLNRDGNVSVNDSLMLGQALLNDCANLTDTQKRIADVADPRAAVDSVPSCTGNSPELDSADVAEISSLALDSGASSAGVEASDAEQPTVQPLSVNRIQSTMTGGTLGISAIGQGITGMQVDVFNLSGDHVISERATTDQLRVRMSSNTGQPLANGVYLYTVTI